MTISKKSFSLVQQPSEGPSALPLRTAPIWLWIGVGLAFTARLALAWVPVTTSFALSVPDDAYYYFTIAHNLTSGVGVTFDGLAPTNGFHPLWLVAITAFWFAVGSSQTLPVHLALTLGALFDLVTIFGIWRLASSVTQRLNLAAFVVLVYALNPYNLMAAVNGLETSLGAMIFVWSLVIYWRIRLITNIRWQDWLAMGGLWSFLLLARTDYLIIVLPCALDLAWRQRHNLRHAWVAGLGMLVWVPWLTWNWTTFASFSQVSGKAYPYYLHTLWQAEGHSFLEWLVREARIAYGIVANLSRFSGFDKLVILLVIFSAGLAVAAWIRRGRAVSQGLLSWQQLTGLIWPTLGAILLLLTHGLMRWMYVPWYFVPSSILIALWFGVFLGWIDTRGAKWAVTLGTVTIALQIIQGAALVHAGGMWAEQARVAQEFMANTHCKSDEIIGISDSGYYGYYLPCRVVNLDGVVNNQAFYAIQQGRFRQYLDQTGISRVYLNDIIASVVALREGAVPPTPPFSDDP